MPGIPCVANLIGVRLSPRGLYCSAHCILRFTARPPPRVQDDSSPCSSSQSSLVVATVAAHPVATISQSVSLRPGPLTHRRRRQPFHLSRSCWRPTAASSVSRSHRRVYLAILVLRSAWGSPPWRSPEALLWSPTASPLFTRLPPFLFGRYPPGRRER